MAEWRGGLAKPGIGASQRAVVLEPAAPGGVAFLHARKTAAELVLRCPQVLDALCSGQLCLTAVAAAAPVLAPK